MISDATLKKIYEKVDAEKFLDHYNVKIVGRNGPWLRMHCILPDHMDTTPSANLNTETGMYKCFSCNRAISFFNLVKALEDLSSFDDAVSFVKKKVGYEDDDDYIEDMLAELNSIQSDIDDDNEDLKIIDVDLSEFDSAIDHFDKVKFRVNEKMIKFWDLKFSTTGYYKDRLVIPITEKNRVVSFCARDMSGRAEKWRKMLKAARKNRLTVAEVEELQEKYECKKILYPPVIIEEPFKNIIYGSSIGALMFNFDKTVEWAKDYIILVEGAFDAMKLFSIGFSAAAILGTKLSSYNRAKILANFDRVYVALDNDENADDGKNPGQEAAEKICKSLKNKIETYNILLPNGKDPDECDADEFEECYNNAVLIS